MSRINVTKTYLPPLEEYESYLKKIWENGTITNNGPFAQQLVKSLEKKLNVSNLVFVSNGTVAIQLAIKALDLSGEVITTPFSYVATTTSLLWENCSPVFVDIEPNYFCIDPDKIEAAITANTTAILATHVFGLPCDVDRIDKIAKKHNLKVIYDGAHAFGCELKGRSLLSYGDITTLSFHATKIFHTGEGGAVICSDADLANKVTLLSRFGHTGEENYISLGINAKNSELHAAMGLCVLPKIDEIIETRKKTTGLYDKLIDITFIKRPQIPISLAYNYAYYPVIFETHEMMMKARENLIKNSIFPRRYFYPSLNTLPYIQSQAKCPVSESIASRVLCLPLYFDLLASDVEAIASIITNI